MTDTVETPTSLAESLRRKREKLTEEREPTVFPLPGYGKDLQVKYRVLDRTERKAIMAQVFQHAQAGEERNAERGYCSTLAKACVGFYTEREGKLVALNDAEGVGEGLILWGDERLAELFGMRLAPNWQAREIVEHVLGNDDTLEEHHNEVSRWMETSAKLDDADF